MNGVRLGVECDMAFRTVRVTTALDKIGECDITFDYPILGSSNTDQFEYGSLISVHLGYKDDTCEVFSGTLTDLAVHFDQFGRSDFVVTASSPLYRLESGRKIRTFQNLTPPQAIRKTLDRYDLQLAETDSFGDTYPYWKEVERTDWQIVCKLAKEYGRDIYSFADKVYVKQLMMMHQSEHIYEWGKSLSSFRGRCDVLGQVSSVCVLARNQQANRKIKATVKIDELDQKVGGRKDFLQLVNRNQQCYRQASRVFLHGVNDIAGARERAEGILRERSFKFMRGEGKVEGDARLKAGAVVNLKYVGDAFSGEWIAHCVIQRFSREEGFTTEFFLKRNMLDEEFKQGATHNNNAANVGAANVVTEELQEDVSGGEDERAPECYRLMWRKGGGSSTRIEEALVDDEVTLYCEVKNIADGETVRFKIFEDGKSKDDPVDEVEGTVEDGKVQVPWTVSFEAEEGSNVEEELEAQGWTLPDYYFEADYGAQKRPASAVLKVKDWRDRQITFEKTGEIAANRKYTLILPNKEVVKGITDEKGRIMETGFPISEIYFFLNEEKNG
jgi:phage protein D